MGTLLTRDADGLPREIRVIRNGRTRRLLPAGKLAAVATIVLSIVVVLSLAGIAVALAVSNPVTDLVTGVVRELKGGVNVPPAPLQQNGEPAFAAATPATCDATSHPDPSPVDGRVPASAIAGAQHGGYWPDPGGSVRPL